MKKEKPVPLHEMGLRDFFAAFAMMGCVSLATKDEDFRDLDEWSPTKAYEIADMMMEERKKSP